jgi:transposase-like protein
VDRIRRLNESAAYLPSDPKECRRANAGGKEDAVSARITREQLLRAGIAVAGSEDQALIGIDLDTLAREGARRMLMAALLAEIEVYVEAASGERDERDHALVVRNGYAQQRQVTTAAGAVAVRAPRVNDRRVDDATGQRLRFRSVILPPYARRSPKVAEVLPLLYLHGLSTKDFVPALAEFFGSEAGLSASVVSRLTASWEAEVRAFAERDLTQCRYVYCWADGIHVKVRLGDDRKLCLLVVVGVRLDGTKELVALADGYRESKESWADLLRDCKRRGMAAPVLAVGDGALGFWAALREVFPATREQRDWVHKTVNVLSALPASVHRRARAAIAEMTGAENRDQAGKAIDRFAAEFGVKWPKAVAKIEGDREELVAFYDFPAQHWVHLRTSNPIESTFASVRARSNLTKGPGSKAAALAMVFKLIEEAERRWRRVNAPELVALVAAGAKFVNGELVEESLEREAA